MAALRKNKKMILLCAVVAAVICLTVILVRPSSAGLVKPMMPFSGHWLSQYEGQNVRITFVSAPLHLASDFNRITYLRLIEADETGIVVGFRPQRTVFFPYSQIVSIEPSY